MTKRLDPKSKKLASDGALLDDMEKRVEAHEPIGTAAIAVTKPKGEKSYLWHDHKDPQRLARKFRRERYENILIRRAKKAGMWLYDTIWAHHKAKGE